jgi:hypothetical protein
VTAGTDRTGGLLEPTSRPAAEIQHAVVPLEFGELVDRSRAKALALGALVEVVLAVVAGDGGYFFLAATARRIFTTALL